MFSFREFFKKHLRPVFVETGSYHGESIQSALDVGYPLVYSCELSPIYHKICLERYAGNGLVHLRFGSSPDCLSQILPLLGTRATFWLDAHHSGGDTAGTAKDVTVLQEIAAIEHFQHRHDSAIIMDDANAFGNRECWLDNVSMSDVLDALKQCCPQSAIYYDMGADGIGLRSLICSPSVISTNPQIIHRP